MMALLNLFSFDSFEDDSAGLKKPKCKPSPFTKNGPNYTYFYTMHGAFDGPIGPPESRVT
jgi:hypothetical protein